MTISNDGSLLASAETTVIAFPADILVWEFKSKHQLHRFSLHKGSISGLAFSPSARLLASVGGRDDNQLVVWDLDSAKPICSSLAHTEAVHSVRFMQKSETALVTAGVNHVKVWTLDDATQKLSQDLVSMGSLKRTFLTLAISPDDRFCYCGTQTGDLVEVDLARRLQRRLGPVKTQFPQGIVSSCLIPNGDLLIGTGEGIVAKVALSSLRVVAQQMVSGSALTSLTLTPDGTKFFAGSVSSSIFLFDTETLRSELRATSLTDRVNAIAFPHNMSEVFATASLGEIRLWNSRTKQEVLSIRVPNVDCFCVDFSLDGKSIVSGWADGKIRAFTPQTGTLLYSINDAHKDGVTALRALSDCARLVSGGMKGEVRVWKVSRSHQELSVSLKEHRARVWSLAVRTEDDARAVTASADGSCIIWDLVKKCRLICIFESTVFKGAAYHPDFSQIVTVGTDKRITYYDVFDGQSLRILEGAADAIAVTRSGSHFIVGGDSLKVFDYDDGILVARGEGHSVPITAIAVSPSQDFIVSGAADGSLFFWSPSSTLVDRFTAPIN